MYANVATKLAMCIHRIKRIIAVTTRGAHIITKRICWAIILIYTVHSKLASYM